MTMTVATLKGDATSGMRYSSRRGWEGGDSRTLYAIVDKRTGGFSVRPGGDMAGVGPEVIIRVATRGEAESHWQSPLHSGWTVADGPA